MAFLKLMMQKVWGTLWFDMRLTSKIMSKFFKVCSLQNKTLNHSFSMTKIADPIFLVSLEQTIKFYLILSLLKSQAFCAIGNGLKKYVYRIAWGNNGIFRPMPKSFNIQVNCLTFTMQKNRHQVICAA